MESSMMEIQDQYCSSYDKSRLCSFDVEFIDNPTKPLIHQAARFLYFFKGTGTISVNGVAYDIIADTLVAILPWDTSEITAVSEPLQFYKIIYNTNSIFHAMRFYYNSENEKFAFLTTMEENPVVHLSGADAKGFLEIMQAFKNEIGIDSVYETPQEKELGSIFITSKLVELVVQYLRVISRPKEFQKKLVSSPSDRCRLIFKYLYSHLSEHLTLDKISAVVYMSKSSISKHLTELTGLSFGDVLNEMRIAKATDILAHTGMTLNEVAGLCGFVDASHLSKAFSARVGITANEYRRVNKRIKNIFKESEKTIGFEIIAYIHENYNDANLRLQTVMDRFDLTASEVNKILMLHTERNFDDFVNYIRINQACEYLLATKMRILDIAVEVGYNNGKTFNRNFIKSKNMTPGDFRKTMTLQIAGESIEK